MKNSLPGVSLIILTWNGLKHLKQSLDSIVEMSKNYEGESEIIIVDNGSMDRTVDVITDFYPFIKILSLDKNYGYSIGCNKGAEISKFPILFFLNNDIFVPKQLLQELINEFIKLKDVFSLSPKSYLWEGKKLTNKVFSAAIGGDFTGGKFNQHWAVNNYQETLKGITSTLYGSGAALLVDKEKFFNVGRFQELYSPAYFEDVDLCYYAWKKGWGSYCTHDLYFWHKVSGSSGGMDSDWKKNLSKRNENIFFLLNIYEYIYFAPFIFKLILRMLIQAPFKNHRFNNLYLLKNFKIIFQNRLRRKKESILSDSEVLTRCKINVPCWKSSSLNFNFFKAIKNFKFSIKKIKSNDINIEDINIYKNNTILNSFNANFQNGVVISTTEDLEIIPFHELTGNTILLSKISFDKIPSDILKPNIFVIPYNETLHIDMQVPYCLDWWTVKERKILKSNRMLQSFLS
jgi:GT2 family glycosyltransferase